MSIRRLALVSLVSVPVACTQHAAEPRSEPEPGTSPRADPRASHEPPTSPAPPTLAWRWEHRGDGSWSDEIGPKSIFAGGWTCDYTHDDEAHTPGQVCCVRDPARWCVELDQGFVPGVALASDGERLFIADFPAISSGARFEARNLDDGAQLWTRDALAIGPQSHSEYFNVVQLRVVDDTLIAYGDEAHGAYVEAMRPTTGALVEHLTRSPPQVEWRWDESAPELETGVTLAIDGGARCTLDTPASGAGKTDPPVRLSCQVPGAATWARDLPAIFVGRGAMVSDGTRLIVVTWCRIASGAQVRAFNLADGEPVWEHAVEGLGPQDHSKYSNSIQLELAGDLVEIRGLEAHGHYVESYAVASGDLHHSVRWPNF